LVLTKLDGTAKGGVAIGISDQFRVPIKFLGMGEGINDLQVFDRRAFVDALFKG
jgi:fused signal recognition particle receptor